MSPQAETVIEHLSRLEDKLDRLTEMLHKQGIAVARADGINISLAGDMKRLKEVVPKIEVELAKVRTRASLVGTAGGTVAGGAAGVIAKILAG